MNQASAISTGLGMSATFEGLVSKNFLPPAFQPGKNDVVIGRGRKSHMSFGNERLHRIVASKLDEYSAASSKTEKSKILSVVVYLIRNEQPSGLFVKQDSSAGLWFDVGDLMAREKVSQAFRDALHGTYRSSNEFKKKRRLEKSASLNSLAQTQKKFKLLGVGGALNAEWGESTKKTHQPKKFASTSSLLRSSKKSKLKEVEGPKKNAQWKIGDDFLRMLDTESDKIEANMVSKFTSSLPSSSFLAEWFEEEDTSFFVEPLEPLPSFEPYPLTTIPDKENEDASEHLPSPSDFEDFMKSMDVGEENIGEESLLDAATRAASLSSLPSQPAVLV